MKNGWNDSHNSHLQFATEEDRCVGGCTLINLAANNIECRFSRFFAEGEGERELVEEAKSEQKFDSLCLQFAESEEKDGKRGRILLRLLLMLNYLPTATS